MTDVPELVWHYTTTAGLRGILLDHKIRATSVSFVNDPMEQRIGSEAVAGALAVLMSHGDPEVASAARVMEEWNSGGLVTLADQLGFADRYVACASEAEDSLDLWRGYGAHTVAGTFAIGLDRHSPLGLLLEPEACALWKRVRGTETRGPGLREGWLPMTYIHPDDLQVLALKQIEGELPGVASRVREHGADRDLELWRLVDRAIADVEATYKHVAYKAEREVRLQVPVRSNSYYKIAERAYGLSAFVELTATETWGEAVTDAGRLPVREVVAWPGAPAQALYGVAAALNKGGHNYLAENQLRRSERPTVRVRRSTVPFVQAI